MTRDYTTDNYGNPARPTTDNLFRRTEELPYTLGEDTVRKIARRIADSLIANARSLHGPVVWVTGNAYMPPFRDLGEAERVWNADNNRDGGLFAFLVETVEDHLSAASLALESPEWDNALYVVDLARWQYREDADDAEDLNDEWEPVDPDAVDDNAENPRE